MRGGVDIESDEDCERLFISVDRMIDSLLAGA
jgi:hypothetical protein